LSPTRLLQCEAHSSSSDCPGDGRGQGERRYCESKKKTEEDDENKNDRKMCDRAMTATQPLAIPVALPAPPTMKGVTKDVTIVRMSRGRRMSEEAFNSLPEKDKIRVLRNRRNALQTRARRQARIKELSKENALLEASVELKQKQVAVLLSLLGGGEYEKDGDVDEPPASPTVVVAAAVPV
jgi:hypothetical protein